MGLPGATTDADAVARVTPSHETVKGVDDATAFEGWWAVGCVMYATRECAPVLAAYATRHWLDCMQAPIRVPVVWSKISIANGVPLTLSAEVAVSRALCPGCSDRSLELRSSRGWALATESVEGGTLGATGRLWVPNLLLVVGGSTAGNTVSLQDAGVVGPAFAGSTGQRAVPTGAEATPGETFAGTSATWHVTCGPELGHCWVPAGSWV
jgi:hypothetical protein